MIAWLVHRWRDYRRRRLYLEIKRDVERAILARRVGR